MIDHVTIKQIFLTAVTVALLFLLSTIAYLTLFARAAHAQASPPYGWLHTDGNEIKDTDGNVIRLTGVNWFGMEGTGNIPHGLGSRNWESMLDQMAEMGYNTIRLPFANETLEPGKTLEGIDKGLNPDFFPDGENGIPPIEVMDMIIEGAGQRGMMVILDNHLSLSGVTTNNNGLWYEGHVTHEKWIEDWVMLTERYKDNPTVVGMDLHNEPKFSCWGCDDPAIDWRGAAEEAGNAILDVNPNVLILVEGVQCYDPADGNNEGCPFGHVGWCQECTWWGGNLQGVRERPIEYDVPNQLVYSPHEYTQHVYNQVWFSDPDYPNNLNEIWDYNWGFIHDQEIAPLLFGEFGTPTTEAGSIDGIWYRYFIDYIVEKQTHFTYWAWNPNSGDTGGLLQNDWQTPEEEKNALLAPALYPFEPLALPQLQCNVRIEFGNVWEGGFGGNVIMENVGPVTINDWTLTWTQPDGMTINQVSEASYEVSGDTFIVTPPSWGGNTIIARDRELSFGFGGLGEALTPTDFAINGIPCVGVQAVVTPTPGATATATTAPATPTATPTTTIPLTVAGSDQTAARPSVLLPLLLVFAGTLSLLFVIQHRRTQS